VWTPPPARNTVIKETKTKTKQHQKQHAENRKTTPTFATHQFPIEYANVKRRSTVAKAKQYQKLESDRSAQPFVVSLSNHEWLSELSAHVHPSTSSGRTESRSTLS
jgi:hypothetical protein